MKLLLENSDQINTVSENDIQNSIEQINQSKLEFIILQKSDNEFLQCAKTSNGKLVEYHHNKQKKHLRYNFSDSEDELISAIFIDFLRSKEIGKNIADFERFSIESKKDFTTYISRVSFVIASIMLIVMIWDSKINDSGTSILRGMDVIYFTTIMFIFLAIGFSSDLDEWEKLRSDSKTYVIASIFLAVLFSIISIIKLLN